MRVHLAFLVSALICLPAAQQAQMRTISGTLVDEAGQPLAGTLSIYRVGTRQCCAAQQPIAGSGQFHVLVDSDVYVLWAAPARELNRAMERVDVRASNVTGLVLRATDAPAPYADAPPRASRISATPSFGGVSTIRGEPGAVDSHSTVALVTLDTGHTTYVSADAGGDFTATLFAPAGSSVMVKYDPKILFAEVFGRGEGAPFPLSGTIIRVPDPPSEEVGSLPFVASGTIAEERLPAWTFDGSVGPAAVAHGGTIRARGTLRITSPSLAAVETITAAATLFVKRLSGPDGQPAVPESIFYSMQMTPTGLPIEMQSSMGPVTQAGMTVTKPAPDRLECVADASFTLPEDYLDGYYRTIIAFNGLEGVPVERPFGVGEMLTDKVAIRGHRTVAYGPIVRVGSPAAPRLPWVLLADDPSAGMRGVTATTDRRRYEIASRVVTQSDRYTVERLDARTGRPRRYRLEPFVPSVSVGDRGIPPSIPLIPFRFPSGSLHVTIHEPSGNIVAIGPAPFVQSRSRALVHRDGHVLDRGGGHPTDIYQLSTGDPRFEVEFDEEGRHIIHVEGEIEDTWGGRWSGGGDYEVWVGRSLVLDTALIPGTPLRVGEQINAAVRIVPPVPADVEVRYEVARDSVPGNRVQRVVRGRANRFGVFQPPSILATQSGEYRIDVTASYRDGDGTSWSGARTWGSVVVPPEPDLIAHGRRGVDPQSGTRPLWFFRSQFQDLDMSSTHVPFPFVAGDVTWQVKSDSSSPILTFQDPVGDVAQLVLTREHTQPPGTVREGVALGEIPTFISSVDGTDAHIVPAKTDLWGYSYRSVQRPQVRVREEITPSLLRSLYWRFNESFAGQPGVGPNGDLGNDFKFQFGGIVWRGDALAQPHYARYASLFVLVPDDDPLGTRTTPAFRGNGGGPDGGPLFRLKGKEVQLFFHPTALRPGSVLQRGEKISLAGYSAPTLASKLEIEVITPSGRAHVIRGQANDVGYFYDPSADFVTEETGVFRAKVRIFFDGRTSAGQVDEPYPAGDLLGSPNGEFSFYVVDPKTEALELEPLPRFVRPADGPISFGVKPPSGLSNPSLSYTTTMPGFLLEEGTTPSLTYVYDAPTLGRDFPNLDLHDADGRAGADTITISLLLTGTDSTGAQRHLARQIILQGDELQITRQEPEPAPPRRRAVRH